MIFIGDMFLIPKVSLLNLIFSYIFLRLTLGSTHHLISLANDPSSNSSSNVTTFHNTMNPVSAHLMRRYACSNNLVTPSTNTQTPTNSNPLSDDNPSSSKKKITDVVLNKYQNSNSSNEIVPYDPGVHALLDEVKRVKQNKISLSTREQ